MMNWNYFLTRLPKGPVNATKTSHSENYKSIGKDLRLRCLFEQLQIIYHTLKTVQAIPGCGTKKKPMRRFCEKWGQSVENTRDRTNTWGCNWILSAHTIYTAQLNQCKKWGSDGDSQKRTWLFKKNVQKDKLCVNGCHCFCMRISVTCK